jgi:hypothetical protein
LSLVLFASLAMAQPLDGVFWVVAEARPWDAERADGCEVELDSLSLNGGRLTVLRRSSCRSGQGQYVTETSTTVEVHWDGEGRLVVPWVESAGTFTVLSPPRVQRGALGLFASTWIQPEPLQVEATRWAVQDLGEGELLLVGATGEQLALRRLEAL